MSDERLIVLFAVRFPVDIAGLDDKPFDGDRDEWLRVMLQAEGPELMLINSLCDADDVTFFGWKDERE